MIEVKKLELPEVVPQAEVIAYKESIAIAVAGEMIHPKLAEFIDAVAAELGDMEQESKYTVFITGVELGLANIEQINGMPIVPHVLYPIGVPVMKTVNRRAEMYRIYHRQGKAGLINYLKVKTSKSRALIEILNMHVFGNE